MKMDTLANLASECRSLSASRLHASVIHESICRLGHFAGAEGAASDKGADC